MNSVSSSRSRASASCPPANHSSVSDFQWIAFIDEITRRLEKENSFILMHAVMEDLFHFDRPFFAELTERARHEFLPFTFVGEHSLPCGDPARIVFSRRKRN